MRDDGTAALREHGFRIPVQGDSSALKLAEGYGLVSENDMKFIRAVLGIRNRYAHNVLNYSKSLNDIILEGKDKNQVDKTLRDLRHGSGPWKKGMSALEDMEFGAFMFLAAMAGRLKTPEMPTGRGVGLLGEMFEKMREDGELGSAPDPDAFK